MNHNITSDVSHKASSMYIISISITTLRDMFDPTRPHVTQLNMSIWCKVTHCVQFHDCCCRIVLILHSLLPVKKNEAGPRNQEKQSVFLCDPVSHFDIKPRVAIYDKECLLTNTNIDNKTASNGSIISVSNMCRNHNAKHVHY